MRINKSAELVFHTLYNLCVKHDSVGTKVRALGTTSILGDDKLLRRTFKGLFSCIPH